MNKEECIRSSNEQMTKPGRKCRAGAIILIVTAVLVFLLVSSSYPGHACSDGPQNQASESDETVQQGAKIPEKAGRPGLPGRPSAKRVGPPEVKPVTIGKQRFEAIHWGKEKGLGQNGGYIAAYDVKTGKEIWTLKIYQTIYDPKMEQDVQDVFIKKMRRTPKGFLEITDENNRRYMVDPRTKKVEVAK